MSLKKVGMVASSARGFSTASFARGFSTASSARGSIAAAARGFSTASSAAPGRGFSTASSARGSFAAPARGSIASSARGSIAAPGRGFSTASSTRGSIAAPARGFSTKGYEPSERAVRRFELMVALTAVAGGVGGGFYWVSLENKKYTDAKLVDVQTFQNIATGTHYQTVRTFNGSVHDLKKEVAELRSKILDLEQREFEQREPLQFAAGIISNHQAELAAAAAK